MTIEESNEIAISLMRGILADNGCINRAEKESFSKKHLSRISKAANIFFTNYPHLLTDDIIEEFVAGEQMELKEKFDGFDGFFELDKALDAYFNSL